MSQEKQVQVSAVLVAAGSSRRMGFDKLSYQWEGKTVLQRSVEAFDRHPLVDEIILVTGEDQTLARALAEKAAKPVTLVRGGATRADSVLNGVRQARGALVAIHDAARPFASEALITEAIRAAQECGAAAPAVPVKDTIKIARGGCVADTPDRSTLFAVQTPQCFDRALYLQAVEAVADSNVTDDCQLLERAGYTVRLTQGDYANYKITTREDLKEEKMIRIGHGYDVHKFAEDRKLIIGGVDIPYEKGLLGHSDADVLSHAVTDALFGAAAMGDIGRHFPDTDPAYKGADSLILLQKAGELLAEKGWKVQNIDATILCQKPKLAPHIEGMRQNIARMLGLELEQVSVKATTEEGLGFTGKGEGIAVHAVALIER